MPRYWSESDTSDTPPAVSGAPNTGLNIGPNTGNGLNTGLNTGNGLKTDGPSTGLGTGNGLSCWYDQLRQNPGILYQGPSLGPVTRAEAGKERCSVATKKEKEEEEEKEGRSPLSGARTSEEAIRRLVQDWLARVRAGADTELEAEERSPVNPRLCVRRCS